MQNNHRITSAYHPQSNHTIIRLDTYKYLCKVMTTIHLHIYHRPLYKVVDDRCDKLDQALESVLFAIHASVQASSKYLPYEIAFGRKVTFPLEHVMQLHRTVSSLNETAHEALYKQLQEDRAKLTIKANVFIFISG